MRTHARAISAGDPKGQWVERTSIGGRLYAVWLSEIDMPRIENALLETSVFLYPSEQHARDGSKFGGSGFFASFVSARSSYLFIVTCRHVALDEHCTWVRVSTPDGGFDVLDTDERLWFGHPDDSCDVAVCPIRPEAGRFRFTYESPDTFLTMEKAEALDLGPGDDVLIVGRFINHDGKQKNLPTVRFGNIAQMPDEKILDERGREQEVFLVDGRSIPGFSGSPAYVIIGEYYGSQKGRWAKSFNEEYKHLNLGFKVGPFVLGINAGHSFREGRLYSSEMVDGKIRPIAHKTEIETGLAMVIPA